VRSERWESLSCSVSLIGRSSITVVTLAMALAQSKVTAQGQISVPMKVRRKLGRRAVDTKGSSLALTSI